MNRNFSDFSGFVLAGGKSSRMKTDKAFLKFGGETFLARAASALETVCESRVKIVLNRNQTHFINRLPPAIPYLFDVFENRGALGGIHAALKNCPTKFAIILACDLPFITNEVIKNLAEIALDFDEFPAVVPRQTDERLQPLCAVYRAPVCLPKLEKYLSENSSNAVKDFLNLINAKVIEADLMDASENLFFNVNYPFEYRFLDEI
jgi:molybdenum cofactor guanylyltransferase